MFNRCAKLRAVSSTVERYGEPLVLLAIRLWMSYSFFTAGMSKLDNYLRGEWTSTVYIFQNIYPLPGVPAEIIAPIWTGMELVFPVLFSSRHRQPFIRICAAGSNRADGNFKQANRPRLCGP